MARTVCSFLTCGCKAGHAAPALKTLLDRNHRGADSGRLASGKAVMQCIPNVCETDK